MQELLGLQVLHSLTDVFAHLQQLGRLEAPPRFPQEVQEAAVGHVLGDDEDGALLRAHPVELHQLLMRQVPVLGARRALLSIRRAKPQKHRWVRGGRAWQSAPAPAAGGKLSGKRALKEKSLAVWVHFGV